MRALKKHSFSLSLLNSFTCLMKKQILCTLIIFKQLSDCQSWISGLLRLVVRYLEEAAPPPKRWFPDTQLHGATTQKSTTPVLRHENLELCSCQTVSVLIT
jgi:hypothetical protein